MVRGLQAKLVLELKDTQDALLVATSSIARKQKDLENIRNLRMRLEQNLATQEEAKNQSISTTGRPPVLSTEG